MKQLENISIVNDSIFSENDVLIFFPSRWVCLNLTMSFSNYTIIFFTSNLLFSSFVYREKSRAVSLSLPGSTKNSNTSYELMLSGIQCTSFGLSMPCYLFCILETTNVNLHNSPHVMRHSAKTQ